MIKSEDGIKRRGDFFWSVGDFSFEKDAIGHNFTGHYYVLHWYLEYQNSKPEFKHYSQYIFTHILSNIFCIPNSFYLQKLEWKRVLNLKLFLLTISIDAACRKSSHLESCKNQV